VKAIACITTLALGACGVKISDGARAHAGPDAAGTSSGGDASTSGGIDATGAAPADAAPTCSNGRVVYLNFDGVTLKSTQVRSDATINAAYWANKTLVVPPYHATSATRATDIAAITAAVTAGLGQFPVTVVTTRPAVGPYVMVAFGGTSKANFGYTNEYYAINKLDCDDAWKSDVAWVSDIAPDTTLAADYALGAIGFGLGLSGNVDPNDCMCGWNTTCDSADVLCTFSAASAVEDQCNNKTPTTQDEVAVLHKAFCE
jgi:hypothetical protein